MATLSLLQMYSGRADYGVSIVMWFAVLSGINLMWDGGLGPRWHKTLQIVGGALTLLMLLILIILGLAG